MSSSRTVLVFIGMVVVVGTAIGGGYYLIQSRNTAKPADKLTYLPQSAEEKSAGIKPFKAEGGKTLYDFEEFDSKPENNGKSPLDVIAKK